MWLCNKLIICKEEGGIKKALKVDRCELVKEIFITSNSHVITHVSSYNSNFSSNSNLIKKFVW